MVGLILDIWGVVVLFFARDKGLNKLSSNIGVHLANAPFFMPIRIRSSWDLKNNPDEIRRETNKSIEDAVNEVNEVAKRISEGTNAFIRELNNTIETTNKNNRLLLKQSQRWLWLLISGFVLQFLGAFLPLVVCQ